MSVLLELVLALKERRGLQTPPKHRGVSEEHLSEGSREKTATFALTGLNPTNTQLVGSRTALSHVTRPARHAHLPCDAALTPPGPPTPLPCAALPPTARRELGPPPPLDRP